VRHPVTPDGRYFVVRGRLWRCSDPALSEDRRTALQHELMSAMRAKRAANKLMRNADDDDEYERGWIELSRARDWLHDVKVELGERGPVWWDDGARDWNRHMARNTPYAEWFFGLDV